MTRWIASRMLLVVAAVLTVSAPGPALSLVPRTDIAVSAWSARTGEPIWTHEPHALSEAWFELFPHVLTVHGTVYPESSAPYHLDFFLASDTGVPGLAPGAASKAVARSDAHSPVVLDNGWKLVGFDAGDDQELVFEDAGGAVMWTLDTGTYPHVVDAWPEHGALGPELSL